MRMKEMEGKANKKLSSRVEDSLMMAMNLTNTTPLYENRMSGLQAFTYARMNDFDTLFYA